VGGGRPVTSGGALKPALVPEAAVALGLRSPVKVRRASDVPGVHRPWVTATATGHITVSGTRAVQVATPNVTTVTWLAGLEEVLRAQIIDPCGADPRILCHVTLTILATDLPPLGEALRQTAGEVMRQRGDWTPFTYFSTRRADVHPVDAVLDVLQDFGALDRGLGLTPLGHYARTQLEQRIPSQITPELPAGELLALLAGLHEQDIWEPAWRWLDDTSPEKATRELLLAATDATPAERIVAIDVAASLGETAASVWRELSQHPNLGPHARMILADFGEDPDLDERDRGWLAVEYALAALSRYGITDACYVLQDLVDPSIQDAVEQSGHPGAGQLRDAVSATAMPIPLCQLKISLRSGLWRRILIPENTTLGRLHDVIRVLMGWDGSHLHAFTVGKHRYSDPFYRLEECGDEEMTRLNRVLPAPKSSITYVYDFGDDWQHEILLEKVLEPDDNLTLPLCVGGSGDNPIEDYNPEYPEKPIPFDQDAINKRLAGSTR
jgi:hypothetical protein